MRLNWNFPGLAIIVALAVCGAGCSGINAGTSVSPATFLLPGIMKSDLPATNAPVLSAGSSIEIAAAR